MRRFEITPHKGIGPITLNMTRQEVESCLGVPEFNNGSRVGYLGGFMVNFNEENKVEFIELAKSDEFVALFNGKDLHSLRAEEAIEFVQKFDSFDENDIELGHSYIFKKLQLSLWPSVVPESKDDEDGQYFEAVGVAVDGYFS